jgi:hypothetical protein
MMRCNDVGRTWHGIGGMERERERLWLLLLFSSSSSSSFALLSLSLFLSSFLSFLSPPRCWYIHPALPLPLPTSTSHFLTVVGPDAAGTGRIHQSDGDRLFVCTCGGRFQEAAHGDEESNTSFFIWSLFVGRSEGGGGDRSCWNGVTSEIFVIDR